MIASGGYGGVYSIIGHPELVVKFESVGQRLPNEFFHELITQNEAAKSGYVGEIKYYGVCKYPRKTSNNEPEGDCWFYVIIMDRYQYSLKNLIDLHGEVGLSMEAIQKIALQLTLGLHHIHQ